MACSPNADCVSRSAHSPPHQLRSSGVENSQTLADARTSVKPARPSPGDHAPAGVGLPAGSPGHSLVEGPPFRQLRIPGKPEEPPVVPVSRGDDAARPADPPHLGQRGHRVGQVLQHLVRVHDVESRVVKAQVAYVADIEGDIALGPAGGLRPGIGQRLRSGVNPRHLARRQSGGQVDGDRAGPAADIEHARRRGQPGEEVAGRVLGGPPPVRAQHAVVVAVQVGLAGLGHVLMIAARPGAAWPSGHRISQVTVS